MCHNGICTIPCLVDNPCAANAECFAEKHSSKCKCHIGFTGDPYKECLISKCKSDVECPKSHLCQQEKCINICQQSPCGENALCKATNHVRYCTCPPGYEGDPEIKCQISVKIKEERCTSDSQCPIGLACLDSKCRDACGAEPCGAHANCLVRESLPFKTVVCKCKPGYQGDAYTQCRPSKNFQKILVI